MKTTTAASIFLALSLLFSPAVHADTFGSGANQFDIEFIPVGDADNPDGTTGNSSPIGKVEYAYRMGKYEISRDMITKANSEGGLGITMASMDFVTGGPRDDMPATGVSWFEAATFVNWLNTSTGHTSAYKFNGTTFELWQSGDAGYNPVNPFRNTQAFYFLPSADEWHKAAYYDPSAGVYFHYPTGSDTAPTAVASGTAANTAVYDQPVSQGPADITLAGGLSPYGTIGQGGNVREWEETENDRVNDGSDSSRGIRGGLWNSSFRDLRSSDRFATGPANEERLGIGFRVASLPEPSAALLGALAVVGMMMRRRRLS